MGNKNSGRRPQATALKVLRGNPSKTPLNQAEPQPPEGEIVKPSLSPEGSAVWDEMAPICVAMRTLTPADVPAFKAYCELQATFNRAAREKSEPNFKIFIYTTMVDSAGNEHVNIKEHPALRLERNTAAALRPYYEKFGLEPSGRARISVPKAKEPVSKWA